MLLETSLSVATSKTHSLIYENSFQGRVALLAKRRDCNLAVQKLFNYCQDKTVVTINLYKNVYLDEIYIKVNEKMIEA